MIHEIEENKDYAILISTNAGAWRYAIGDTVTFGRQGPQRNYHYWPNQTFFKFGGRAFKCG